MPFINLSPANLQLVESPLKKLEINGHIRKEIQSKKKSKICVYFVDNGQSNYSENGNIFRINPFSSLPINNHRRFDKFRIENLFSLTLLKVNKCI